MEESPNTCCSKKILLLLMWQALFTFSWSLIQFLPISIVYLISIFLSFCFAPLIGWLADVRFGRYKIIKFGSIASFLATILYYFAVITGGGDSTLSNVLSTVACTIVCFGLSCYSSAMKRKKY